MNIGGKLVRWREKQKPSAAPYNSSYPEIIHEPCVHCETKAEPSRTPRGTRPVNKAAFWRYNPV